MEGGVRAVPCRARSRIRCLALVWRGAGTSLGGVGVQVGSERGVMGISLVNRDHVDDICRRKEDYIRRTWLIFP